MYGLDAAICPTVKLQDIQMPGRYHSGSAKPSFSNPSPIETTEGTGWLIELARAKRSGALPNLKKISLIERTSSSSCRTWGLEHNLEYSSLSWHPPNMGFELAGIEFSATIRALPVITKCWDDVKCIWVERDASSSGAWQEPMAGKRGTKHLVPDLYHPKIFLDLDSSWQLFDRPPKRQIQKQLRSQKQEQSTLISRDVHMPQFISFSEASQNSPTQQSQHSIIRKEARKFKPSCARTTSNKGKFKFWHF